LGKLFCAVHCCLKERKAPVARNARINQLARNTNLSPKAYAPTYELLRRINHSGAARAKNFPRVFLRKRAAELATTMRRESAAAAEPRRAAQRRVERASSFVGVDIFALRLRRVSRNQTEAYLRPE
jgi:hypothetical protein